MEERAVQEYIDELELFIRDASKATDDEAFDRIALRAFAMQYERNAPFRSFCLGQGRTPRTVRSWKDIPAVPIGAFKTSTLSCMDHREAQAVFMTSGTTNPNERGRHYHPSLHIYDLSMQVGFGQFFMKEREKLRMGILFPAEAHLPNSSLAHYLALAVERFGTPDSVYLCDDGGVDVEKLAAFVRESDETGRPVALLGATFSLVQALDACEEAGMTLPLPEGSLLFDTGGTKGRSRSIEPEEFYNQLSQVFGVPREYCINMYGMTELSTQFYDIGNARTPSWKRGPHWIRTRAVDPLTGRDVPIGSTGVLAHCDLANWNSVTTILTEDLGVIHEDGKQFQLLGRVEGTAARGCSLAAESFLEAARRSER